MNYSNTCVLMVKKFEGCSLTAYQDAGGWSIGYGHHEGVMKGQTITLDEAEAFLVSDLTAVAAQVEKLIVRTFLALTQNQFDALCDFAYNVGVNTLRYSRLLYLVNQGLDEAAAHDMLNFCHSQGKIVEALVLRREAESELYLQ
jgi:lysozyme